MSAQKPQPVFSEIVAVADAQVGHRADVVGGWVDQAVTRLSACVQAPGSRRRATTRPGRTATPPAGGSAARRWRESRWAAAPRRPGPWRSSSRRTTLRPCGAYAATSPVDAGVAQPRWRGVARTAVHAQAGLRVGPETARAHPPSGRSPRRRGRPRTARASDATQRRIRMTDSLRGGAGGSCVDELILALCAGSCGMPACIRTPLNAACRDIWPLHAGVAHGTQRRGRGGRRSSAAGPPGRCASARPRSRRSASSWRTGLGLLMAVLQQQPAARQQVWRRARARSAPAPPGRRRRASAPAPARGAAPADAGRRRRRRAGC